MKAVKGEFIVLVYISMHVPEKFGNYEPQAYFSSLCVCINGEKNAASVLRYPHWLQLCGHGKEGVVHFYILSASSAISHTSAA